MEQENIQTRRATVPELEAVLYQSVPVLDHGFIRVVDYMGSDAAIVQAARVSYGEGTKKAREDRGLIRYLMRHSHTTPFEMCEIKLHVKLPIFVARQWIRHRTANVNECSARYSILDKEYYIPEAEHIASQSQQNHQGRSQEPLCEETAEAARELLRMDAERCYDHYEFLLGNGRGVARELARMSLSLNFYTQWYWKIDLHNLMHFLQLRADSHAQYEIRVYADAILDIMKLWVPCAYEAFMDYRMGAFSLSAGALSVVKQLVNGNTPSREDSGLSEREWDELMAVLEVNNKR